MKNIKKERECMMRLLGEEAELHIQAAAKTTDGMIADAHRIQSELGTNTFVKIPASRPVLKP